MNTINKFKIKSKLQRISNKKQIELLILSMLALKVYQIKNNNWRNKSKN